MMGIGLGFPAMVLLVGLGVCVAWGLEGYYQGQERAAREQGVRSAGLGLGLARVGLVPGWALTIIDNFLKGGQAWAWAEKAKIADLNWRIVAEKPAAQS